MCPISLQVQLSHSNYQVTPTGKEVKFFHSKTLEATLAIIILQIGQVSPIVIELGVSHCNEYLGPTTVMQARLS